MKPSEIELWVRDIVDRVERGQSVEDSRVELKSSWIDPSKAAKRLAGHANSSHGENILWLIGIDEDRRCVVGADQLELANWMPSVERHFDGFAPRLVCDVKIQFMDVVVALYFETEREAPYVVKNENGGFPEFIVPWRSGTRVTTARREDLLRILVPRQRISAMLGELEFNAFVCETANTNKWYSLGASFRRKEFDRGFTETTISSLPSALKNCIFDAYSATIAAKEIVIGALNSSLFAEQKIERDVKALKSVVRCSSRIEAARSSLSKFISESSAQAGPSLG